MDQAFIDKQKELINQQISALEKTSSPKYDEIGWASEDNAAEYEEFEESTALSKEANKELTELKLAKQKIEEGKYGICEVCGESIETSRLESIPAARFCATHAK